MRFLIILLVFFSFAFFPKAFGETPPLTSLMECTYEDNHARFRRWRSYQWEKKGPDGVLSIFIRGESPNAPLFEYIADGEEHDFPHADRWAAGVTNLKYVVDSTTEGTIRMIRKGLKYGSPWQTTYETIKESSTGIMHTSVLTETSQAGTEEQELTFANIGCIPIS